jgi:Domain of unknown function (DUF4956)
MDSLTSEVFGKTVIASPIGNYELLLALGISAVLTLVIAKLYMFTHGGYSYSRSFLQTIVLVGVTVALIMVIIGSDIARAFALVGAMSIVRFRTPVKDSRDLVFVFAAIAVGMAAGTQFYVFAAIFTAVVVALMLGFHFLKFGEMPHKGYVIKVRLKSGDKEQVAELCRSLCKRFAIVSISRPDNGGLEDVIYEIELKRGIAYKELLDRLSKAISPLSINILVGEGNVTV